MVLIPDGAFTMGDSVDGISDADPVSTTVSAFYMDVTEVTLSQWQVVQQWATLLGGYTALTVGSGKGQEHPVHTVNWYDCVKWCNARSEREGKTPVYYTDDAQTLVYKTGDVNVTNAQVKWSANGYRLPTEAEWEKAARGGLSGKRFPWGDTISHKQANYIGLIAISYDLGPNGYNPIGAVGGTSPGTSPVGTFAANGYGLYDMAGNVYEKCWDWYGTPYAGGTDPHGAATGSDRVARGGSWDFAAVDSRCATRGFINPDFADSSIGFRAVLAPGQ
jgi:formylglycine-generating enzyme required for sulfatase activity